MSSREIIFSAAGFSSGPVNYIEDVFSTWLYTGTGLSVNNTITNGIDLAGKGGLVWTKARSAGYNNAINDTNRGFSNYLSSNSTGQQNFAGSLVTMTANSNGYTVNDTNGSWNESNQTFVSWTFRKQPKFFDVVTYTGNGASSQTISHSLGSTPGMITVKATSTTGFWAVFHREINGTGNGYLFLNTTAPKFNDGEAVWGNGTTYIAPTSTNFTVAPYANASGVTYVAYLFAHDAGGFGAAGTDNVISCGSFTTNASGEATINLGYEPQWVMVKATGSADQWAIVDVMRGFNQTQYNQLRANSSGAESTGGLWNPTATGFYYGIGAPSATYIYMAIRRGPMKTPTSGTEVFSPSIYTGTLNTSNPNNRMLPATDLWLNSTRNTSVTFYALDRLRGWNYLATPNTNAENASYTWSQINQTTLSANWWNSSQSQVDYYFRRAPGFFDEVCYTGTGSNTTQAHNLGVVPELIIVKKRSSASGSNWCVYNAASGNTKYLYLNTTDAEATFNLWNDTTPTSTVFSLSGNGTQVNGSGSTYVAYLFASVAGVSKVGSYTGTGSTQTINAGLPTGARYVLIKRTDSTGDWWVWDTARGMVSGTDPRLALNSTAAETNANWVYTVTNGFQIVTTDATVNASGGSYIYLAIA